MGWGVGGIGVTLGVTHRKALFTNELRVLVKVIVELPTPSCLVFRSLGGVR